MRLGGVWRNTRRAIRWLTLLCICLLPTGDAIDLTEPFNQLAGHTSTIQFSYAGWMIDAIAKKIGQEIGGVQDALTDKQGAAYVHDYLQWVGKLQTLDAQIAKAIAKPAATNADAKLTELRQQRDAARAEVARRESLAESIAESQVAAVLRSEGFDVLGQIIPPVAAHLTELPALLVISPRDTIRVQNSINIVNQSADQAEALESQIDHDLGVSSLVVPLGGLSLFPSMVIQTWHAPTLFEVMAHEWCHHYLYFFPLGLSYDTPEARILNESTAVLFGREIGRKVVERFYQDYPDILAQLPPRDPLPMQTRTPTPTPNPDQRPPFDFGAEMNTTRVHVDELLQAGKVAEAEQYMEARRRFFNQHGYGLRKLNQAYFAFYGGYQGAGGSNAGGIDPIGPALRTLRDQNGSIHAWLEVMRGITTRAGLLQAAGE
jgi:hypothetical protein